MDEPDHEQAAPSGRISPLTVRVLIASLFGLTALQGLKFARVVGPDGPTPLVDFDAFHIVGLMIQRGALDQAYAFDTMGPIQKAANGGEIFMPWTYPPPFDLVVGLLGWLPLWLSYLVFTGGTLGAFLLVLRRFGADVFGLALVAAMPALMITIICGQNGFLTAALIGAACLARADAATAGLSLGLMAVKPHLALTLGLYTLATRRWGTALLAAATVLALCGIATIAFGPSVWTAFLHGLGEARIFLAKGLYPMYRMISAYAFLLTLGLPSTVALAGQMLVALLSMTAIGMALHRGAETRHVLGLAVLSGLMVSPYAYDYDLPIAIVGFALLLPDVLRLSRRSERVTLFVLSWTACGWGMLLNVLYSDTFDIGLPETTQPLSLGGAAFPLLFLTVWRVLARGWHAAQGPEAASGHLRIAT